MGCHAVGVIIRRHYRYHMEHWGCFMPGKALGGRRRDQLRPLHPLQTDRCGRPRAGACRVRRDMPGPPGHAGACRGMPGKITVSQSVVTVCPAAPPSCQAGHTASVHSPARD